MIDFEGVKKVFVDYDKAIKDKVSHKEISKHRAAAERKKALIMKGLLRFFIAKLQDREIEKVKEKFPKLETDFFVRAEQEDL